MCFCQRTVVGFVIELAMFGEYETIDRDVPGLYPLAVILHFGAAVIRFNGMRV